MTRNQSLKPNCVILCFFQIVLVLISTLSLRKGTHLHHSVSLLDDIERDCVRKEAHKKELAHSF